MQNLNSLHYTVVALGPIFQSIISDEQARGSRPLLARPARLATAMREWVEAERLNLSGDWFGLYGGHGLELVRVTQRGYLLTTVKLRGDVNVPTGKPTFEMVMRRSGRRGIGRIHLADPGYRNAHWGFATIEVEQPGPRPWRMSKHLQCTGTCGAMRR